MNQTASLPDVEPRVLRFAGARNFRDFGGYPAAAGRHVRWRRLYRAGHPADMPADSHEAFGDLGLACVFDLRSNHERRSQPYASGLVSELEHWYRDYDFSAGNLGMLLNDPAATADEAQAVMLDVYRALPYEQSASFRALFERLAAGRTPLLVNCSAGKDRTGVACALVLTALGVPRERVVEDYMLTEKVQPPVAASFAREMTGSLAHFAKASPEVLRTMLGSPRISIETMFREVERRHGSVENYLGEVLGVDAGMLAAMRADLLTDEPA